MSDGVTATWNIDNAQTSWTVATTDAGTYEEERCVYDHDYTVSMDSPAGYQGSIEVFTFTRCSPETCCLSDQLYFENRPQEPGPGPGELYWFQQYDPRVRAWYYNAPIQYALNGQVFGWSDVYAPVGGTSTRLTISATRILAGDSGSIGGSVTQGSCKGDYYMGADFSASPATLVVTVDGVDISISLSTDLTAASDGVAALNAGLGSAATASLDARGKRIFIESALAGAGSSVSIDGSDISAQTFGFAASTQIDGVDASSGTYIAERVPHRSSGPNAPPSASDPPAWVGFDFSDGSSEDLILVVDGINITIPLTTDLDDYSDAVDVINAGLGGAASASLDSAGKYMTITSSSTGPTSSVALGPDSGDLAKKMLCPVVKSILTIDLYLDHISEALKMTFDENDIVYIVERSTGFLIAESAGEGVSDEYGNRKCAVSADNELMRQSALQLDNFEPKWDETSSKLDATHYYDSVWYQRDATQDGWGLDWLVVVVQFEQCPMGQSMQQVGHSVACTECPVGKVSGDGLECVSCPQGRVTNREQSECDQCPDGSYHNEAQTLCLECPVFQVATEQGDSCICAPGYFDAITLAPACHLNDYIVPDTRPSGTQLQCKPCGDSISLSCIADCQASLLTLEPGWMILEEERDVEVNIYRCNHPHSCPGGNNTKCAVGYKSTLCALCEDDYVLDGDGECTPCGEMNRTGFVAAFILILILIYILKNIRVWFNAFGTCATIFGFMDGLQLKPVGKCLIATLQILGGLAVNLKVVFPLTFQSFLDGFVSYFRFDIVGILIHLVSFPHVHVSYY